MTCKARIKLRLPGDLLRCYTFGAPGVMAHREGGGGDRVCRVMGLDPGRILCFCLDDDPVPRAMLAVDPAYSMVKCLPSSPPSRG